VKNLALNKITRSTPWSRCALGYCSNCTKFGKLILRKIIEIAATRYHILKLKCTKFNFGWDLTALPQAPRLDQREPTSKGRKDGKEGQKGKRGMESRGREGREGREGEERGEEERGDCVMAVRG